MEQSKEYYAFISYKSEDVEWAIWLQHELEHYHLPASFNGRTDIRQELRPVFRDIDELSAGNLPEQIQQALENSQNLIVVCSPQAAASPWVNQEVETFISLGRTDRIFPFIVEGNSPKEFFPPALLALPKNEERLGGDAAKQGRDIAFVKVVAGMLGLGFDSLWNRYEKEKAEEERKQREQRDKLLIAQSRFVAEKANDFIEKGDSYIARKALLELYGNDESCHPYVAEADRAFRRAVLEDTTIMDLGREYGRINIPSISLSKDGSTFAIATHKDSVLLYNSRNGKNLSRIKDVPCCAFTKMHFSEDNKLLIVTTMHSVRLYDLVKYELINEWRDEDLSNRNHVVNARFTNDKNIFIALSHGKIVALNIADFATNQQFQYEIAGIYIDNGRYYVEDDYTGEINERHSVDSCRLTDFIIHENSIVASFNDGKLRIIQFENSGMKTKIINDNIHSLYLSNNNLVVASSNSVRIYNPKSLRLKKRFDIDAVKQQEYIKFAYLKDKVLIVSFNSENYAGSTIRFYYWKDDRFVICPEWDIKDTACITDISIDKDYTKLLYLTNAGKVRLWTPRSFVHKDMHRFNCKITNIYSFNKELEAAIETIDGIITILNYNNGVIKRVIDASEDETMEQLRLDLCCKKINYHIDDIAVNDIIYNKDSAIITDSGFIITPGKNGKTLILETANMSIIKELICPDDYVDCIFNEISPDEKYIVTASCDGNIYIWEFSSALLMQTYSLSETISAISFSSDGKVILIGTEKGMLISLEWRSFDSLIEEQKRLFSVPFLSSEEKKMFYM